MAFIKVGDTVINTSHIVAVDLDHVSMTGRCGVEVLIAAKGGLFKRSSALWFEGEAATKLRDYFSDPANVNELLPSSSPRSRSRDRIRLGRSSPPKRTHAPPVEPPYVGNWDEDPTEEPPPPPTVRRRPWGPKPPSPLSTTAFPDTVDPTVP